MEAARLPMLCFDQKNSSDKTNFTSVLLNLISTHFEEDSSGYAKECEELDKLRTTVIHVPVDYSACGTLKRYYCQLCFLLNRFPFLVGTSVPGLHFTWEDTYQGNSDTHSEVEFEKAAVLYNIGAMHSFLGISDNRSTADGMKVSCTHLQCAAWAFQQVRDNFNSNYAADWTYEILSFQEQTMLAQSQECILEKSMTDNRKSSITVKVAAQCAEFYKKALSFLESSNPTRQFGSSQVKEWKKHLELKVNFTQCVTYYYTTLQAEEQQNYGERMAYAQAAAEKLADCVKLSQGMGDDVKTSIQFINDVVAGKYIAAKKENDFVYHEKIPPLDSLPEIKGAVLVKGIGFDVSDKAVSGPDIFSKLVPMEAHEASSLYSEEKAQLLRNVGGKLEEHDVVLGQYLASLQIDVDKLLPQFDTIPDVLVEKCAAISVRPDTMKDLSKAMNDLAAISTATLADIDETERILQEEAEQEEEFQTKYGKRRILVMFEEISSELDKCKQAFTKASASNAELHKAMDLHIQNLNLLASPLEEIKSALPNPQAVLAEEETTVVARLKQLFTKIGEMKTQRSLLYEKLRAQVMADDITKNIVTRGSDDTKKLFAAQLKKHDILVEQIDVYMNAQPRILEALDKANVDFVPIKQKIDMTLQQRAMKVEALVYSYDVYQDLLDKQQKGIEFYQKLKHNVQRLLEKVKGLNNAQKKERDIIAEKMKPKGPPPTRPTASKPGSGPQAKPGGTERPKPSSGPPKLKDYLPFMKGGGNAAAAIDSIADGASLDDDMDDVDDVELPDVSSAPKLKDFLPFMSKGGRPGTTTAPSGGTLSTAGHMGAADDLSELAPQLLKYLPQNMRQPTANSMTQSMRGPSVPFTPSHTQRPQMPVPARLPQVPQQPHAGLSPQNLSNRSSQSQQPHGQSMHQFPQAANAPQLRPQPPPIGYQGQQHRPMGQQPQQLSLQPPQFGQHPQQLGQQPQQLGQQPQQLGQQPQQLGQQPQQLGQLSQQLGQQPQQLGQQPQQLRQQPQPLGQQPQQLELGQQPLQLGQLPQQFGLQPQQFGHQPQQLGQQPQQLGQQPQQLGQQPQQLGQQPQQLGQHPQQLGQQPQQLGQQPQQFAQQPQPMGQQPRLMGQQPQQFGQPSQQRGQQPQSVGQQSQQLGPQPQQLGQPPQQFGQLPQQLGQRPQQIGQQSQHVDQQLPQLIQQSQHLGPQAQQMRQQPTQLGRQSPQMGQQQQCLEHQPQKLGQQPQHLGQRPHQIGQQFQPVGQHPQQMGQQFQHLGQKSTQLRHSSQQMGQQSQQIVQQPQQMGQQTQKLGQQSQQLGQLPQPMVQQPQQMGQQPQRGQQAQHMGQQIPQTGLQSSQSGQQPSQMGQQHPHIGKQLRPTQSPQIGQQPQNMPQSGGLSMPTSLPNSSNQAISQLSSQGGKSLPSSVSSTVPNAQFLATHRISSLTQTVVPGAAQHQAFNPSSLHSTTPCRPSQTLNAVSMQTLGSQVGPFTSSASQPQPTIRPELPATSVPQSSQSYMPTSQTHLYNQSSMAGHVLPHSQPSQMPNSQLSSAVSPAVSAGQFQNVSSSQHTNIHPPHSSPAGGAHFNSTQLHNANPQQPWQQANQAPSQNTGHRMPGMSEQDLLGGSNHQSMNAALLQPRYTQSKSTEPQQPQVVPQEPLKQNILSQPGQHLQPGQQPNLQQTQFNQPPAQPQSPHPHLPHDGQGQQVPPQQVQSGQGQQVPPQQVQSGQGQQVPPQQVQSGQGQQVPPQQVQSGHGQQVSPLQVQQQSLVHQTFPNQTQHLPPSHQEPHSQQPSQDVNQLPNAERNLRNWPQNQTGMNQPASPCIPVLAVSPQPKSHVSDLEGVSITSTVRLDSAFESKIDWSKATITPDSFSRGAAADVTNKVESSNESTRRDSTSQQHGSLSRQTSRDNRDPYSDEAALDQFVSAVERYVKQLDALTKPSLKGPTPLDKEWQDMCEEQERESKRNSTAAGLSESTRNRHPDVIPYDKYRVTLSGQKNDYINASLLENLSPGCPRFIAAQGPLGQTEADFWTMIIQHKVELILMLSRWTEQDHSESARYWPRDRSDRLSFGNLLITLQLTNNHKFWIERKMAMTNLVSKETHICTQLQFTCWPSAGLPEPMPLLMLVKEVTALYKKQRSYKTPIIVHCGNGISKTGVFCTLYNAVLAVNSGQGITNVANTVGLLRQLRKGMVSTKDEYLFCHTALLYYAQDILVKRGILTSQASFANSLENLNHRTHGRTPSNDFIMSDTSLALIGEFSINSSGASPTTTGSTTVPAETERVGRTSQVVVNQPQMKQSDNLGSNVIADLSAPVKENMSHEVLPTKDADVTKPPPPAASTTLLDIANPQTFDIGEGRQRTTKANFTARSGGLKKPVEKSDDPFSSLDPMWSLTSK